MSRSLSIPSPRCGEPRGSAAAPGPLQIIPAAVAVNIQHLAAGKKSRHEAAFQGHRVKIPGAALKAATVTANYPLAVIRVTAIDAKGTETVLERKLFGGAAETGVPRSYTLGELPLWEAFDAHEANKPGNQIRIDVIVSTGETFTPITIIL